MIKVLKNSIFSTFDENALSLRTFALGIANAKCKENLAFQVPKCSASGIVNGYYCKKFWNCATVQFYLVKIKKIKIKKFILFL